MRRMQDLLLVPCAEDMQRTEQALANKGHSQPEIESMKIKSWQFFIDRCCRSTRKDREELLGLFRELCGLYGHIPDAVTAQELFSSESWKKVHAKIGRAHV